jgi:CheY-like chemotaxis protein/cytidylate kinase
VAVITLFSGSFCRGEEVAAGVASRLGYEQVEGGLLDEAAQKFGVARDRLVRTLEGPPPFLSKLTHEREKNVAFLRSAMAELVLRDGVVYHGFAGHLVPRGISHVLSVCLIANLPYRIAEAARQAGLSEKQAVKAIHRDDGQRLRWTREMRGRDPYDESLYDLLLAMQAASVESAVQSICDAAAADQLRTTADSRRAAEDFVLAARVEVALAPRGYTVEVRCSDGEATIALNQYVSRLDAVKRQLESEAAKVPGVSSARCIPGPGYVPPSLLGPTDDLEPPSKILLVDDEREFVHTLSERLQARNLEAAVVYDGEEALKFVASDEPEVMVLDIKMPGIDGIEVLRRVKQDHPAVEVIILTGHGSQKEEEIARQLGAFAYLRKPVDIELLTKTMKQAYRKIGKPPRMGRPPAED